MKDMIQEIEAYVKRELGSMSPHQINTLKALLYSGYKGEREAVLLELLKTMGEERITSSPLAESFTSVFEGGAKAIYWRIKPEFYRAVRNHIFQKH